MVTSDVDELRYGDHQVLWRMFRKRKTRSRPAPIDHRKGWVIGPPSNLAAFMRALPRLLPANAVLVLEGAAPETADALGALALDEHPAMRRGTLFPPTRQIHLPVSASPALAQLLERYPENQLCWHFHAVTQERILLEWWDAFGDPDTGQPWLLSDSFSRQDVESFCRELGCEICIVV
jgi:hypothetical protein